jgi:hypothetical protein
MSKINWRLWQYRSPFHYVAGGVIAWRGQANPILALALLLGVVSYEALQDWRKGDNSFHDVLEVLIGLFAGAVIFGILELVL